jgi:hypothetical protein
LTAEITVADDTTKTDRPKGTPANRPAPAPIRFRRAIEADRSAIEALQHAAYDRERLLGLEPPPLKADYADIMTRMEVWLAEEHAIIRGVLILDVHTDDLVIWSIAASDRSCWTPPKSVPNSSAAASSGSILAPSSNH